MVQYSYQRRFSRHAFSPTTVFSSIHHSLVPSTSFRHPTYAIPPYLPQCRTPPPLPKAVLKMGKHQLKSKPASAANVVKQRSKRAELLAWRKLPMSLDAKTCPVRVAPPEFYLCPSSTITRREIPEKLSQGIQVLREGLSLTFKHVATQIHLPSLPLPPRSPTI